MKKFYKAIIALAFGFASGILPNEIQAQSQLVCNGEQVCLTLTGIRGNIQWQSSDNLVDWLIIGGGTNDTLCFIATEHEWFRAEVREGSCEPFFTDTIEIDLKPRPTADGGPDIRYCIGDTAQLGGTVPASGGTPPYTWAWSPPAGLSSTSATNPSTNTQASVSYVFTVTDSNGCQHHDTVNVTVNPLPSAEAGMSVSIPCSLTANLGGSPTASGGLPPYTYLWTPNLNLSSDTSSNPIADPNDTTVYTVEVTDANGCSATDTVTINVYGSGGAASGAQTFSYTGSPAIFVIPSCVDSVLIECWGGQGANSQDRLTSNATGGLGGYAKGRVHVSAGDTLYVYVGGQGLTTGVGGYNGGGSGGFGNAGSSCIGGYAGGGGGASDVRLGGTGIANRIIVAGGGGGSGRDYCNGSCQPCGCGGSGGSGGGTSGVNGSAGYNCGFSYPGQGTNYGYGATPLAGGTGGSCDVSCPFSTGGNGAQPLGGTGADGNYDVAGGGGGGGYFGGGGGGSASSGSGVAGGGGGGGSSFIGGVNNGTTSSGIRSGDGQVIISW